MEIRYTGTIEDLNTKVWGTGLRVSVSTVQQIRELGWKRLRCTFGGSLEKSTSLTALGGEHYLILNKQILRSTGRSVGDQLEVVIREEDAEFGMEMPETMAEALAMDADAHHLFLALSPGKRRNLIYIVSRSGSADQQIHKALVINQHLKQMEGRLDFKMLNQQLRHKA